MLALLTFGNTKHKTQTTLGTQNTKKRQNGEHKTRNKANLGKKNKKFNALSVDGRVLCYGGLVKKRKKDKGGLNSPK
jgi:3D (Asp-Asp-Asp) domain-containing protein